MKMDVGSEIGDRFLDIGKDIGEVCIVESRESQPKLPF